MSAMSSLLLLLLILVRNYVCEWQYGCDWDKPPFEKEVVQNKFIELCKTEGVRCPEITDIDECKYAHVNRNEVLHPETHETMDYSDRKCCKEAAKLKVEQREQRRALDADIERGIGDIDDAERWKRNTLISYRRITDAADADTERHEMSAIHLDIGKAASVLREGETAAITLFQTNGQLDKRWSSGKSSQHQVAVAGLLLEEGITADDKYVLDERVDSRRVIDHSQRNDRGRPYGRIGVVSVNVGKDKWNACTGTVIGVKWVLTAAHCLYIAHETAKLEYFLASVIDLSFFPHFDVEISDPVKEQPNYDSSWGWSTPIKFEAKAVYIPYAHMLDVDGDPKQPHPLNDIALIEMNVEDMGLGYLAFGYIPARALRNFIDDDDQHIITIGYPADKVSGDRTDAVRSDDDNFKKQYRMHNGLVMGKGNVKKFEKIPDRAGVITRETDANIPATEISSHLIVDNKYRGFQGQSGSSIFNWFVADRESGRTPQYASFAVYSMARSAKRPSPTKFEFARYCRITYFNAKLFNDIITETNDVVARGGEESSASARVDYIPPEPAHDYPVDYRLPRHSPYKYFIQYDSVVLALLLIDELSVVITLSCIFMLCLLMIYCLFRMQHGNQNEMRLCDVSPCDIV